MAEMFDDLSRIVGSGIPRRRMLKLIAVTFAGGTIPALWPTRAATFDDCLNQQSFELYWETEVTAQNCNPVMGEKLKFTCCEANRVRALAEAQSKCPNACPVIVAESDICNGLCNGNKYICASNDAYHCSCNAPAGQRCCGRNTQGNVVYCSTTTQKCCGNFCVAIKDTCSGNPG